MSGVIDVRLLDVARNPLAQVTAELQQLKDIATTKAGEAAASAATAAAAYEAFDDRDLGAKAADPTLDNDGNALQEGAVYWNTVLKVEKRWNGSGWVVPSTVGGGPIALPSFTQAALPAASDYEGSTVFVSDTDLGGRPAYSDGLDWRRSADDALLGSVVMELLFDKDAGLAADFTFDDLESAVLLKGHTSGNGLLAPDEIFLNGSITPKRVYDVNGDRVWTAHNFLLNSENLAAVWTTSGTPVVTATTVQDNNAAAASFVAQNVSLIIGAQYTATFRVLKDADVTVFPGINIISSTQVFLSLNKATGAVSTALSNTLGATVDVDDDGTHWLVKITFVAAAVTTTFRLYPAYSTTLGGAASNASVGVIGVASSQLNYGAVPTAYLPTTSVRRAGIPITFDPVTHECLGILREPARTNLLLNTYTDLVTQNVTVTAQAYTLSFTGTGTVTLSGVSTAGPLVGTGVDEEVSLTFTPTAGTLTLTVSGTVSEAQLEAGSNVTSHFPSYGASAARDNDNINVLLSSLPALGAAFSLFFDFVFTTPALSNQYILSIGNALAEGFGLRIDATTARVIVADDSVSQASFALAGVLSADVPQTITARFKANAMAGSLNGAPIGSVGQDNAATMPAPTTIYLGGLGGAGNGALGPLYIRRFAIAPGDVPTSELANYYAAPETADDGYDVFVIAGQSNTNSGTPLDGGIDVSGGKVFQMSQLGVVSAADEPLLHPLVVANSIGFALPFARDYYALNALETGRKVLLLACGVGNTCFSDDRWNPGDDLNELTLSMIGVALAKFPNARLRGILWMQGEKAADLGWTEIQYAAAFDAMIEAWREEVGEVPVIVGGMVPGWVAADGDRAGVQAALEATPGRLAKSAYADPSAPTDITGGSVLVHYLAPAQRLFGGRFWDAWETLPASARE